MTPTRKPHSPRSDLAPLSDPISTWIWLSFDPRIARLSGPDRLRFLRVALRIEISTRCVFCVAGRIFIGFLSLPNLVLKLNLNMPKRLRVEAAYRSKTLAYCGSNQRFETSGPANSSTKMAYWKSRFQPAAFLRSVFWATLWFFGGSRLEGTIEFFKLHPLFKYFWAHVNYTILHLHSSMFHSYTLEIPQNYLQEYIFSVIVLFFPLLCQSDLRNFLKLTLIH